MGHHNPTQNGTEQMTPDDVRSTFNDLTQHLADQDDHDTPAFLALLTPRSRARLLFVLLKATEPLTASELCEDAGIDRSIFDGHMDALLAAGVAKNPGKKGNAETYLPNRAHPVTQLLTMAETVQNKGVTPDLLDDQFIGQPGENINPETGEEN